MTFLRALGVAVLALGLNPGAARSQVGSTTDIVTGKVTGENGAPIEGAAVTVQSVETRVSRTRTTGKDGRYTVLFPDGGGQYRVTVKAIGVAPQTQVVTRQGDEDRLVHDFKMSVNAAPQSLAQVTVRARGSAPQTDRPAPGGTERNFSADQMSRLPIDANDLNNLAALTAGVVSTSGTDTSTASFNVAGQRATQNNLTLDGISFGSSSVPQEAVRGTRVITSTYDVARGQFTGGQIATTTRSGTNIVQGSATMNWRDPSLQWTPGVQGAFGQGYNQNTISGGIGGPIIEDQLFYFGALQYRTQLNPIQTITSADSLSLVRLGLDSLTKAQFLDRVNALGLATSSSGIPGRRTNDNLTGIVRLDYNLFEDHTITLRGDYRFTQQDGSRIGSYSTPTHGGNAQSTGSGLQLTVTSRLSSFIHELKGYYSTDNRDGDPYVDYPEGRVRVSTLLPDGTNSVTSLTFGANPALPTAAVSRAFEGTDELSWISPGGEHRVKLGLLYNWQSYDQTAGFNRYGSYTYNSLADFLTGATPAQYTRTFGVANVTGSAVNEALYLGDVWRYSRSWQFTYGVRAEQSLFSGAPGYNSAADAAFGVRTDRFEGETHVSPRLGFTWTIFGAENSPAPVWFVRGGIGEFRGRTPTNLYTAAQQGSGLAGTTTQLTCIGPGVPAPTWGTFDGDPSSIPSTCASGAPPVFSTSAPQVTAFASGFQAPRSWRTSLSVTRRFWERWTASVDAQYAWGDALYGVVDRNLNTTPQFTLASEGNRPVYVPAATITPTTGFTTVSASRVNPAFAQVYEIGSNLKSTTGQVTATIGGFTDKGVLFNLSYTYQDVRDQSS
ncbi:MAG: carboxypeptidase regulatory-like domain-containing protein [Gemmatimonadetes bacterium]|nr:carboxypeptidase regulatory-like domain-containing protein [Gemmatimonadota bacterium]